MKLWTIQSYNWYRELRKNGSIVCNSLNECSKDFENAYKWMSHRLNEIEPQPSNSLYPIWAWYIFDGQNKRPDLRRAEFYYNEYPSILLEIDIPDDRVLLSDEEDWHICLFHLCNNIPEDDEFKLLSVFNIEGLDMFKPAFGNWTYHKLNRLKYLEER